MEYHVIAMSGSAELDYDEVSMRLMQIIQRVEDMQLKAEQERRAQEELTQKKKNIARLFELVRKGDVPAVRELIQHEGLSVSIKDKFDVPILHHAASDGHSDMAQLLLERGADVNMTDSNGWTALHTACISGHLRVSFNFNDLKSRYELQPYINSFPNRCALCL